MKRSYLIVLLLLVSSFSSLIPVISAVDGDPTPIGFEFLDGGGVLRIWNIRDSYYFNVSNGIQFSNHYEEYWSTNVLGIGYYSGGSWNLINWTDSLSGFKKDLKTDWETYINITLWKDLSYGVYDFRLAIRYNLKTSDTRLTIQPYIKNLGQNIPFDIGLAWRLKDIKVSNDVYNDEFYTDWEVDENTTGGEAYLLNQTLDKIYDNNTGFMIKDLERSQTLELYWTERIAGKFFLKIKNVGDQYNAPVTLYINVGPLSPNQEKTTDFYWHDADLIDSYPSVNRNTEQKQKDLHPSDGGSVSATGQSFNNTLGAYNITIASFMLRKYASPTGNAHAVLYAHTGTYGTTSIPTGSPLATSDDFDVTTLTTSHVIYNFTFSGDERYGMSVNTAYCIVIENPPTGTIDATNYTATGQDSISPTHSGNAVTYISGAWGAVGGRDTIFYVYGEVLGGPANNAPTADSVAIPNLVNSDNVYSQHKDYNFNFTVTDADGVDELDFITFAIEIGIGWVNGTIDCQSNALVMDVQGNTTTGAVTNTTLGNSANYILPVMTDWDILEASDNDIHFKVNDTSGDGPAMAEKQTDYFDTINDLVTNAIECTDANNPDRVDISSSIQIDFTAYYENDPSSGTASSSYPPDAEFTSISVYNEWNGVLGTDGTIINGAGSVTGTANASVQSTDYNLYINGTDADYPDAEETTLEAVITDRVNVTLSVPDTRVNVSGSANIGESAVYEYDAGAHSGTITLNDTEIQASVGNYTYTVSAVTDSNYGLTAFLSNDVWCVFDQQQLQTLGANQTTPAANEVIEIYLTSQSAFDAHALTTGDSIELEDSDSNVYVFTWNGTMFTNQTSWPANGTITINAWNLVNETTYIITELDMNSLSLVITVGTTPPPTGNTFDLRVILSEGVGIQNANVRLYNSSGDLFSVNTNSTGYIAQQTFDSGNYTLTILRGGYTTYNHTYSWSASVDLIVALTLDTELAGMGILPLFLGFMGLVVILAAQRRR